MHLAGLHNETKPQSRESHWGLCSIYCDFVLVYCYLSCVWQWFLQSVSEWKAGWSIAARMTCSLFLSLCQPNCWLAAMRERRGYLMRRQCESTWGINGERKRGRKANKLRVIERKWWGQSVIKTQGRWGEDRGRREGMVIDCLVSPHAPVIELIGVVKTKRRKVSVTAEPSKRAIQVKLW